MSKGLLDGQAALDARRRRIAADLARYAKIKELYNIHCHDMRRQRSSRYWRVSRYWS